MDPSLVSEFSSSKWWQALNPAIYLVSVLPGVAVWLLSPSIIDLTALVWATLAVVLLQHSVNLLNDVKDWQLGADTHKFDSWVRIHSGGEAHAFWHGVISGAMGATLGLTTLAVNDRLWIVSFALPLVLLGMLYNAGNKPLSYTPWGEWVTGICYGPGVFGGLWFVSGQPVSGIAVAGMLAFAAFSTALLFSHQPPQIETDRSAGKLSFAVRHGAVTTYKTAYFLYCVSLILVGCVLWWSGHSHGASLWSAILFSVGSAVVLLWIGRMGPNPKRIMLSAALIYLISGLAH